MRNMLDGRTMMVAGMAFALAPSLLTHLLHVPLPDFLNGLSLGLGLTMEVFALRRMNRPGC